MNKLLVTGSTLVGLAFAGIEASAYWWMHPTPTGVGQPVLVYRPGTSRPSSAPQSDQSSAAPAPAITSLPEVVTKSLLALHCSTGNAFRIDRNDGVTIHMAFFEWDVADSTNVLEAYKHLPDVCMGSIGMTLIDQPPPRPYKVGHETLFFDHTIFRDPSGVVIHAFKSTWVSGASLLSDGFRGGLDQQRQIRWKAALKRFRPAYARVAQGAVRGIHDSDAAWQAFEEAMLKDLRFDTR